MQGTSRPPSHIRIRRCTNSPRSRRKTVAQRFIAVARTAFSPSSRSGRLNRDRNPQFTEKRPAVRFTDSVNYFALSFVRFTDFFCKAFDPFLNIKRAIGGAQFSSY